MADEKKPSRPIVEVPVHQGEFMHHLEGAEDPCITKLGAARCTCGHYNLKWGA